MATSKQTMFAMVGAVAYAVLVVFALLSWQSLLSLLLLATRVYFL